MITIFFQQTTECTLQFKSQEEFEKWESHGSMIDDLDHSQIITWKQNVDAFPDD